MGDAPIVRKHLRPPLPITDLSQTFARPMLPVRLALITISHTCCRCQDGEKRPCATVLVCLGKSSRAQVSSLSSQMTCFADSKQHRHRWKILRSPRQICVSSCPQVPHT